MPLWQDDLAAGNPLNTEKPVFASFDVGADMDAANAALGGAGIPRFESGESRRAKLV